MTSQPLWDVLRPLLLLDTTAIFFSHPFKKTQPKKTCARLQYVQSTSYAFAVPFPVISDVLRGDARRAAWRLLPIFLKPQYFSRLGGLR